MEGREGGRGEEREVEGERVGERWRRGSAEGNGLSKEGGMQY